jgi:four helix bundle protein
VQDYKKLYAWQKSHALALRTYAVSATFPRAEMFGLTSQIRRAAVSIPANIAEGSCRDGNRQFAAFLRIAMGSAGELEYYAILAADLQLISRSVEASFGADIVEAKKMITGLLEVVTRSVKNSETEN